MLGRRTQWQPARILQATCPCRNRRDGRWEEVGSLATRQSEVDAWMEHKRPVRHVRGTQRKWFARNPYIDYINAIDSYVDSQRALRDNEERLKELEKVRQIYFGE